MNFSSANELAGWYCSNNHGIHDMGIFAHVAARRKVVGSEIGTRLYFVFSFPFCRAPDSFISHISSLIYFYRCALFRLMAFSVRLQVNVGLPCGLRTLLPLGQPPGQLISNTVREAKKRRVRPPTVSHTDVGNSGQKTCRPMASYLEI